LNILVIDDETVIREGIQRTLEKRFPDYRVFLASRPEEAASLMREHPIQIVLTDILMPEMTGLELMNISRARHPYVKWVVISAYSEFAYAQEAVRLGAKNYLLKPIGKEVLIDMITRLSEEISQEAEFSQEKALLKANRNLLREAVFKRWASGLDIGGADIRPIMDKYGSFHLVFVKLQSDSVMRLEHFIVENVLGELIDKHGAGFVTVHDGSSLLGLANLRDGMDIADLVNVLRAHLTRYLKVPFQIVHSGRIDDYLEVPKQVERLRQASDAKPYEYAANNGDRAVEVAVQYIKSHYRLDLTLEKVASIVYLHPVYFSQLFKAKTGSGFKEYVTQLRLEQAKSMLLNSNYKLADIAERIGYQDIRHFTQMFRKKFAVTPSEFRQTNKAAAVE